MSLPSLSLVQRMLLGIALGDSFGCGVEGFGRSLIAQSLSQNNWTPVNLRQGQYAVGYRLGDYSDDTSDSIALLRALVSEQAIDEAIILKEMQAEWEMSKADRNGVPRAGFGCVERYFTGSETIEQVRDYQASKAFPGNAPPMRSLPLAFLQTEIIDRAAIINANVSHPHPKARAASIAVARAAHYLFILNPSDPSQFPRSGVIRYSIPFVTPIDGDTAQYLTEVDRLPDGVNDFIPHLGEHESELNIAPSPSDDYIRLVGPQPVDCFGPDRPLIGLSCDAMRTAGVALYLIKYAKSTYDGLKRSMLIGGDVDSLGAIVVGILAAHLGLDDIPTHLIDNIENRSYLLECSQKFQLHWEQGKLGSNTLSIE